MFICMKKLLSAVVFFVFTTFTATGQQSREDFERGLSIMEQRGEIRRDGNRIIFLKQRPGDTALLRQVYVAMLSKVDQSKNPYSIAFEIDPKYIKGPVVKATPIIKKPADTTRAVYQPPVIRANTTIRQFLYLKNGDFEQGTHRVIPGWKIETKGFMLRTGADMYTWETFDVVSNTNVGGDYWQDLKFHTGYKHEHWITSKGDGMAGSSTDLGRGMGTITSDPFKLYADQNYISFLVSGANNPEQLKVELLELTTTLRLTGNTGAIIGSLPDAPGTTRSRNVGTSIDTSYLPIAGIEPKTGHNSFILRRTWWDVRRLDTAKLYVIRITDRATDLRWGIINADDFRMVKFNPENNREANDSLRVHKINIKDMVTNTDQEIIADVYVPIYGAADLHTHLMSHLAMGNKLIYGAPDIGSLVPAGTHKRGFDAFAPECNPTEERATTIEHALGNCDAAHGGWGVENDCGNYLRAAILNAAFDGEYEHRVPMENNLHGDHPHAGYPNFQHWPHFSSASHQQMYADWIKRAYEGGLRVLVTLTVNSELLGAVLSGDPPFDDKTVADKQLDEIKLFVERHSDFMEIASTPLDMRRIIRSNKMAVVIGMEVDNIGNFNYATVSANETAVKAEIRRLYNKGVRYIFPIHLVNNKFGGSAVYSLLFNLSNKYTNSRPLPWGAPIPPGLMFNMQRATDPRIHYTLNLTGVPSAGAMNAAIVGMGILFDGISEIPFPPALNLDPFSSDFCPMPKLGCIQQFKIVKSLLTLDPAWDIYNSISGGQQNSLGLTSLGIIAIKEMMKLGMIIDIDHMSDHSVAGALELVNQFEYPVASGHNGMRDGFFENVGHKVSENQRTNEQLQTVKKWGGVFGLGIGESTSAQYLTNFRIAMSANKMNGGGIMMGSDINGFVTMPKPRHGAGRGAERSRYSGSISSNWSREVQYAAEGSATFNPTTGAHRLRKYTFGNKPWDYNTEGVAHIGLFPDYFQDLKNLGMTTTERQVFFTAADYFVTMWDKCLISKGNVR